jgi:hypothetical protein
MEALLAAAAAAVHPGAGTARHPRAHGSCQPPLIVTDQRPLKRRAQASGLLGFAALAAGRIRGLGTGQSPVPLVSHA